jgi:hypothetical protein
MRLGLKTCVSREKGKPSDVAIPEIGKKGGEV